MINDSNTVTEAPRREPWHRLTIYRVQNGFVVEEGTFHGDGRERTLVFINAHSLGRWISGEGAE